MSDIGFVVGASVVVSGVVGATVVVSGSAVSGSVTGSALFTSL